MAAATADVGGADAADDVRTRALRTGLSPEIVAKLSADQIADVLETQSYGANPPWGNGTTRVVASLGFFVSILGIVGLMLWFGFRRDQQRHATLRMLIERGAPLPAELLMPPVPPRSDLRRGILLIALGLGLTVVLLAVARPAWSAGMLPMLVGVGYLVAWTQESKEHAA